MFGKDGKLLWGRIDFEHDRSKLELRLRSFHSSREEGWMGSRWNILISPTPPCSGQFQANDETAKVLVGKAGLDEEGDRAFGIFGSD
jgi:hypothetical protein